MKRRTFLTAASLAVASTAGCSALPGGDSGGGSGNETVQLGDSSAGATGVSQTLRIPVDEEIAGETLGAISATYPRDQFVVDSASHDAIVVGVDSNGDGTLNDEFGADTISGANNNEYSFTVTLDTSYELVEGDVVALDYPAISNPPEPGEYEVTVSLNDGPESTVTVEIS